MYEKLLKNAGLTATQAKILVFLLENPKKKAREIAKNTKISRGVVYKALEELEELELIIRKDLEGEVSIFSAQHPNQLEILFDMKEKELKTQKRDFLGNLPDLASLYSLSLNKPGVRFYEGKEGLLKTLESTLRSKTEILTFLNSKELEGKLQFEEIDEEYRKKRERKEIAKKIIDVFSVRVSQEYQEMSEEYKKMTQIRFVKNKELLPFVGALQIFDNKLVFQIFSEKKYIAVLVENKEIYKIQKNMFDLVWDGLKSKN